MGKRLATKWLTLTFNPLFRGRLRSCQPLRHIRHWISLEPLEIKAWFQRTKNRKWPIRNGMAALQMTSRDPERSNWWVTPVRLEPNILKTAGKTPFQRSTDRKWPIGNRMVMWPMTSSDPERSSRDPNTPRAQYLENKREVLFSNNR